MLVAFSVAPSGRPASASGRPSDRPDDASVHDAVAAAVEIIRASGLPHRTDSMFTTIEGEWDECMAVVRACCDAMAEFGSRTSLVLKADIRPGHTGEITGKVERLEQALAERTNR
ncbi:thiamine-binding protein [Aestuariimicrobium ganziense]|uniref:thiamine-binding protein n=1 Tax=Aestuariimicrobium ganziense TaxID=2773677 RepID=UPI001942C0F3|nr:thiamine-binding protein [Aestuariimicrobium ganziense]